MTAQAVEPRSSDGERKQVTVLFVDVARSMEIAERLDADEWRSIVRGLFESCRVGVERFGGMVDKFTGDGLMALFGAPLAQEDHARRACLAALEILDRAQAYGRGLRGSGLDIAVRVGLNSGEVVAGPVDGAAYTAVGHTVGLAQRMEGLAEPGSAYLTEHTAVLVTGDFRLRPLGPATVKGSTVPVGVFGLESAVGGSFAAGRRGRAGAARLVGRDGELSALIDALDAARTGTGSVLGIVGEAGSGKSRLCDELAQHAASLGVSVRRTAGVSHATSVPLLPILGFLRDYFAVTDADSPAEVRDKIAARLLDLDPDFAAELGLVFDFLEVPDPSRAAPQLGPDARRRRVLEVFRRLTLRRSREHALVIIFEDLHWFDAHSVAFLGGWLPSLAGTRTLVVTNFRPEFHPPWGGQAHYRQIPLAPLSDPAVGELLGQLLGLDPGLAGLAGGLLGRTGGNPFFVEEIVRALASDGTLVGEPGAYRLTGRADAVRVPPTVQAVLAGRIDRLATRDKAVLQAASVIGRTFSEPVLRAVADVPAEGLADTLDLLCTAELLHCTAPGDYRFWHPLTQEVAYGSLVAATRRRHHRAVAEALLASAPERHDELAALVATHYEAAGDALESGRWRFRAGVRAVRQDSAECLRHLRSATAHFDAVPDSEEALMTGLRARILILRIGSRAGLDEIETERVVAEATPLAERLTDRTHLTWLTLAHGSIRFLRGDVAAARTIYLGIQPVADQLADPDLRALVWSCVAASAAWAGPVSEGPPAAQSALAICAGDPRTGRPTPGTAFSTSPGWSQVS